MDQILATESLLPWLDPESSKIYLKVSAPAVGAAVPHFPLVDTSSPLARILPAAFTVGGQQQVKNVFLLMQKDQYSFSETQAPFSNRDIDALWQQTGQTSSGDDDGPFSSTLLATKPGGSAMPLWRSLFYCVHRQRYFHPPCPRCGQLLELCSTDEVLLAAGLPVYSSSLQRFISCPSCQIATGQAQFFAFNAPDNAASPVKDHQALINEFAYLIKNNVAVAGFPCRECPQCAECYGADSLALARIIPLAFYPFRMIVTPARQLNAGDFLSLLTGASTEELAARLEVAGLPGRAACVRKLSSRWESGISLFFQDGRRFLELLNLKLALLTQVSRSSFAALSHLQHADLRLTIDQFWVDFADYEGPLPHFWNFQAMPLAIGLTPPEGSSSLKVPESLGIHSLALLWFTVLLANSRVGAGDISRTVADFYEHHQAEEQPDFLAAADSYPVLRPAHIFWQPAAQQLPPAWLALWQQALELGWSLLRQSCQPAADFSMEAFSARLASLVQEVQQVLFAVEAVPVVAMAAEDHDAAIRHILLDIRQKWQTQMPAEAPEEQTAEPVTLVAEEQAPPPPEQEPEQEAEEELEKTVMLSADQLAAMMEQQSQPANDQKSGPVDDEVPPTIRPGESPGAAPAGKKPDKTVTDEEDDLGKTVVMSADAVASLLNGQKAKPAAPPPPPAETDRENDLEKTVVMSADAVAAMLGGHKAKPQAPPPPVAEKKPAPAKPQLPDASEAGLSETVMIDPKQLAALRKMKKNDK